jgi:hypothetical protein
MKRVVKWFSQRRKSNATQGKKRLRGRVRLRDAPSRLSCLCFVTPNHRRSYLHSWAMLSVISATARGSCGGPHPT